MSVSDLRNPHHNLLRELANKQLGQVLFDEPLSRHTSWKIGGPADVLVEPGSAEQVAAVV
ncbi:MAG: UDP-N-acetylenolpyruvoylglucosamine reductase, partial [Desulfuromonas sp.]